MKDNILGKRITLLREEKGISQIELAKILNVSNTTLSQYESGKRVPNDEIKKHLAHYFEVSIDFLLGITDIRESVEHLIKKGEVSITSPSDLEKLYKDLPDEEKKMLDDYANYLETRAKLSSKDKESSATLEAIEEKKVN